MPNIQIRGSQIQSESVEASNINLSGSFDFRAATSFITSNPSAANDVANKAYVDSQIGDGFQAGDGISINTGTSPDTISVSFAADGALSFIGASSDELSVKVKSETGGSITKDGDGIYIGDGAIGNAKLAGSIANSKLANSTISGVALGSNLASLTAGNGISMSSFNGSTAVNDLTIDLDGSTLTVGADGIKVSTNGVGGNEIAAGAVATANLTDRDWETITSS